MYEFWLECDCNLTQAFYQIDPIRALTLLLFLWVSQDLLCISLLLKFNRSRSILTNRNEYYSPVLCLFCNEHISVKWDFQQIRIQSSEEKLDRPFHSTLVLSISENWIWLRFRNINLTSELLRKNLWPIDSGFLRQRSEHIQGKEPNSSVAR